MSLLKAAITTEGLRHHNRAIVLSCIRENGPSAHTAIANYTGLASGTISVITAELVAEGVLEKLEHAPASGRGRPRILFGHQAGFARFVLVRFSAENVEFSLVDYNGILKDRRTLDRGLFPTEADAFGKAFKQNLAEFVARSKLAPKDISVVSITTKGEVLESLQTLVWSPIFGDQSINFKALLSPEWPSTIKLTNDLCFVAHSVISKAISKGGVVVGDRHAVLSLGDNISLGVAKMGLMDEIELSSPSFGHMPHGTDGPLCRCGAHGCLESYAGFYGILRMAYEAPQDVIPAKFIPLEQMQILASTARNGDRMAGFAFRQAGVALGRCLSRMFNVLGPMPLTIVGRGLEFFDLIQEGLEQELNESFLVRMGQELAVRALTEGSEMAFDSNISVTLHHFDSDVVATRTHNRQAAK